MASNAGKSRGSSAGTGAVPRFFLFGEAVRSPGERFVHAETIASRSAVHDWIIAPHAHRDLHQLLAITQGEGEMTAEDRRLPFGPGSLLLVPAGLVHGFRFSPGTVGHVATVAHPLHARLCRGDPALSSLFEGARATRVAAEDLRRLDSRMAGLAQETARLTLLGELAAEALAALMLVAAVRAISGSAEAVVAASPRAALVQRFRAEVEHRLGTATPVMAYAALLGVSPARLRAACVEIAGQPPVQIIAERLAIEARRHLVHGDAGIADIAYALGFDDPAYFSRFFRRQTGLSPAQYRAAREAGLNPASPPAASDAAPVRYNHSARRHP